MENSVIAQSYNLKSEYANFLSTFSWDFFCTFTTRYSLTLSSARRAMERLHERAADKYGGIRLFWVAEPFDCKDGYHTHGLVYLYDRTLKDISAEVDVDFACLKKSWDIVSKSNVNRESDWLDVNWSSPEKDYWDTINKDTTGNNNRCKLKRYVPAKGAEGYCGKYLFKNDATYDLLF